MSKRGECREPRPVFWWGEGMTSTWQNFLCIACLHKRGFTKNFTPGFCASAACDGRWLPMEELPQLHSCVGSCVQAMQVPRQRSEGERRVGKMMTVFFIGFVLWQKTGGIFFIEP